MSRSIHEQCWETAESLARQLHESKERETELNTQLTNEICRAEAAEQDRDASNAALAIARDELDAINAVLFHGGQTSDAYRVEKVLEKIGDPSAALAERDQTIEHKTAERCIELSCASACCDEWRDAISREFNLDGKPEGECFRS